MVLPSMQTIFISSAGNQMSPILCWPFVTALYEFFAFIITSGFPEKLGTIFIGIIQV